MLVLCNHNTIARVIRIYPLRFSPFSRNTVVQVQHRNFIDYYEAYFFEDQVFTVSEYIEFSVKDMVNNALYPIESEIAYIMGQVGPDKSKASCALVLILQVLAGMRFIESRGESATISRTTVRISREGKVKIGTRRPNANHLG